MISCYRGAEKLSTRIVNPLLVIALACATSAFGRAAWADSKSDAGTALPAGALNDAPSLYLREAASGPIRWQPWGEASLSLARTLNRAVLLDIGAVWCHWCHVMDQTTYADPRVAALINSKFVPIKVDADERPDIDSYYQDAAGGFGAGGWPLTCFTTPDGAPLYIAGYMPPEVPQKNPHGYGMIYILNRVADAYATDPSFQKMAHDIAAQIAAETSAKNPKRGSTQALRDEILHSLSASYDRETGGFGLSPGPRFYDFSALVLALAHGFFGHPEFTALALDSLRKIASGGVYDQLGGGFHRYSTDPLWRVPHFEKMGYDQAMAIAAYAQAYQISGDQEFARIARGTVGYVNSTLLDSKTHTFYSHQDADAFPGDDGSYYTWTKGEVERSLDPKQARVAIVYFGLEDDPALAPDGRVVLRRALSLDQIAARLKLGRAEVEGLLTRAGDAMVAARERRRHPEVDRALLVDRNALMATAYLNASDALGDETLRRIALDDLDYIITHARAPDGSFCHTFSGSKGEVPGLVADQVYMLGALVAAYQASAEPRYLKQARSLADLVMKQFRDPATGLLRNLKSAHKGNVLATIKSSTDVLLDRPTPSVQGSASIALATLGALTSDKRYDKQASELLANAPGRVGAGAGTMVATLGLALEQRAHGEAVIVVVGDGAADGERRRALWEAALRTYRPGKVVMLLDSRAARGGGLPEAAQAMFAAAAHRNVPLAFVCAGAACAKPVYDPGALAKLIRQFRVATPRVARAGNS